MLELFVLAGSAPAVQLPAARSIVGEVVALYGVNERPLLWSHAAINSVYSYSSSGNGDTKIIYTPGTDYIATANGIVRTSGSAIYDFSTYTMTTKPDGTFTWVDVPRNPPAVIYQQVYVDYDARVNDKTIPAQAPFSMTGKKILFTGDSITGTASVTTKDGAFGYTELIDAYFGGSVTVMNNTNDGVTLQFLTSQLPTLLANNTADIYSIAFGMNDHSNGIANVGAFQSELQSDVAQIIAAGKRVILIGFPRENHLWEFYDEAATIVYNNAIKTVAENNSMPFVDIRTMFDKARQVKTEIEMFADNYHHPSNWGHRIYFSGVLPLLLSTPVQASTVPNYVVLP